MRVLALAPHPDDEVLGCGGALALAAARGEDARVLVVFDGALGDPLGRFERATYVARRRAEALAAGAALGLAPGAYRFWALPEGHAPADAELLAGARRLAALVDELRPDVVYAPWIGEGRRDHATVARAARLALELAAFTGQAWGYEVATPLTPARTLDVGAVWERKLAALRAHETQLAYRDLVGAATRSAAPRARGLAGGSGRAEAFVPLGRPDEADARLLGARGSPAPLAAHRPVDEDLASAGARTAARARRVRGPRTP